MSTTKSDNFIKTISNKLFYSLSGKIFILTIAFFMIAEAFVFIPSLMRFREDFFLDYARRAHLINVVLNLVNQKQPGLLDDDDRAVIWLETDIMQLENIRPMDDETLIEKDVYQLFPTAEQMITKTFFLHEETLWEKFISAFDLLFVVHEEGALVKVYSRSISGSDGLTNVQSTLTEMLPIEEAMADFAVRIFFLSLGISVFTSIFVFAALYLSLVRPVGRITSSMMIFRNDPSNSENILIPSKRRDEIGEVEQELSQMQDGLRSALEQQRHLAALGGAVARINHDLRGMLSSAVLISERLQKSDDPEVRAIAPTLMSSIDRAVDLCSVTLDFVNCKDPKPNYEEFDLHFLIIEISNNFVERCDITNALSSKTMIIADRNMSYRTINNLLRNAIQAGASEVSFKLDEKQDHREKTLSLIISDNGPGLPDDVSENLFKAFVNSQNHSGSGLGLSIAYELTTNQSGGIELDKTDASGTSFRIFFSLDKSLII